MRLSAEPAGLEVGSIRGNTGFANADMVAPFLLYATHVSSTSHQRLRVLRIFFSLGLSDDIRTLALLNPGRGGFGGGHSVKIPEATDSRKSPKKIASVYPVIRPESMPSAEITSYKPTSQD